MRFSTFAFVGAKCYTIIDVTFSYRCYFMPRPRSNIAKLKEMGNYRPSRHGTGETPTGPVGRPVKPNLVLSELASSIWDETVELLEEAGWMARTDATTLHMYCELKAQFVRNPADFPATGYSQLRLLSADLGMSPAARAKMPQVAAPQKRNGFADLDE